MIIHISRVLMQPPKVKIQMGMEALTQQVQIVLEYLHHQKLSGRKKVRVPMISLRKLHVHVASNNLLII